MVDISHRVVVIFKHPKAKDENGKPQLLGVTFPYLFENGVPLTPKGKPWVYQSVELIQ